MSRKIEVQIVGDSKSLEAALARSGARTQAFGERMKQTGRTLTTHMTLPIVALGAVAVKTSADFASSMEKIQGLVGANTEQMDRYKKAILSLAPAVAKGPKELADALYFVTSSGFKGAQALDILTQSARASTAGLGDTQQIADLVTSAMTAYGAKTLDAAQATDILVAATKAGKGDPQQFAQALQLNVAAAQTLGITFDQLAAATAALSTVNSNVAEDATQLSGIMTALIKPSAMATKELHKLGLTAGELRKEVRDKGLLSTLLDLKNRVHGNIDALGKLFPNVRGLRGFLTLVGQAAQRNVSIFDQVAHSTGDLNKAFKAALTSDPTKQWERMKAQLQVLAIVIGEQLIPMLTSAAGFVTNLAVKFNGLSEGQQHALLVAAGLLAVMGPLISVIGNMIIVLKAARVAMIAFGVAEGIALGWVALIIAGVIALGAALVIAYKKSETFRNIVNGAFNAVKAAAGAMVDFFHGPLTTAFNAVRRVAGGVFDFVGNKVQSVINVVKSLWGWVRTVIGALQSLWDKAHSVASFVSGIVGGGPTNVRGSQGGGPHPQGPAGGNSFVIRNVIVLDGKVVHESVRKQDSVYRRQNGRSAFA